MGHLCLIWLWALDNAPDGDLSAVSPGELAEVADFNSRRAGEFLEALIDAGFVDQAGSAWRSTTGGITAAAMWSFAGGTPSASGRAGPVTAPSRGTGAGRRRPSRGNRT